MLFSQERKELVSFAQRIYEKGYNVSTDGNMSIRMPNGQILVTPSHAANAFLTPEALIVTDHCGNIVEGCGKPTSEFAIHERIYQECPDINAVLHVHSPYALAASLAGIDLFHQTWITSPPIPTTEYAAAATQEGANAIQPYLRDYTGLILPRHGTVTWGKNLLEAFLKLENIEMTAKVVVLAKACGPISPMPENRREEVIRLFRK